MSNYTQEEIEEMRKRLPFKAVVDNRHEELITIVFDDGICANNKGVWFLFKEIKEPEYVPFTKETIKPFRDEWVRYKNCDCRIETIAEHFCCLGEWELSFSEYLENGATFADTGKPFGKQI